MILPRDVAPRTMLRLIPSFSVESMMYFSFGNIGQSSVGIGRFRREFAPASESTARRLGRVPVVDEVDKVDEVPYPGSTTRRLGGVPVVDEVTYPESTAR